MVCISTGVHVPCLWSINPSRVVIDGKDSLVERNASAFFSQVEVSCLFAFKNESC